MSAPTIPSAIEAYPVEAPRELETAIPLARPAATALALLFADAFALLAAGWLGMHLWTRVNVYIELALYLTLWPVLGVFLLVYGALGLYPAAGVSPADELRRVVMGTTSVYLVAAAAIFLSKEIGLYSRGIFVSCWILSCALVPLNRALARKLFAHRSWWGVPVLVLGAGKTGRMIVGRLRKQPELGLKPVAYLDDDPRKEADAAGVPVAGPLTLGPRLARSMGISHALIAMPGVGRQQLVRVLEKAGAAFTHIIVVPDLFGMASLWVSPMDLGGVLGLEVRQNLLMPFNRWVKRSVDLVMATLLGLLTLPAIAVAVLWIKRVSPGSALYRQEREGEGGKAIQVWKLRTMHHHAEELLAAHLASNPAAAREWRRHFKLRQDPRVLPGIGHLLRRTSLDELPQLWSVLKGEMSLVGPRPFPYYHLEQFGPDFRALRSKVTPGLTGLWQVSERSDGDLKVQESLDAYYIRNWSIWLDIHILARTVQAVIFGKGAY